MLSDGSEVDVDVVLVGLGRHAAAPTGWSAAASSSDNGVRCDSAGRTSAAGVWAVGDLAAVAHPTVRPTDRIEHWTNAVEQAEVVAHNIISDASDGSAPGRDHAAVPYVDLADRLGMIAALVANDTEQVQAVEMVRLYRDHFPIKGLGLGQQACLVKGERLSKGCREIVTRWLSTARIVAAHVRDACRPVESWICFS